jgi:hypothetical protein
MDKILSNMSQIYGFAGRMRVGKDYMCEQWDLDIIGFADPMYDLCEAIYGTSDKDKPGIRRNLQMIGQWGRGRVDEDHRMTFEREEVTRRAQVNGHLITGMGTPKVWKQFGDNKDFWVDLLINRVENNTPNGVAFGVPNVRFPNELRKIMDEGGEVLFVSCSRETRYDRLPDSHDPEDDNNISEQLAHALEEIWLNGESNHEFADDVPVGVKKDIAEGERVIWNDPHFEAPAAAHGNRFCPTSE